MERVVFGGMESTQACERIGKFLLRYSYKSGVLTARDCPILHLFTWNDGLGRLKWNGGAGEIDL